MEKKVLIAGATGAIGANLMNRLLELNIPTRAIVHKIDGRSASLVARGVEIVEGDLGDFNSVSAAMKGISRAFFVYPVMAGLLKATAFFAQAALEEKIELLVNISQRTSLRDAPSHNAQEHWLSERLLDRSGVPVTHLQPTLFMEWLLYFAQEIKAHDRLISPFGVARCGTISSKDIGRVAAAILAKPEGHAGKTYRLYGPAEITGQEEADKLSEILQRQITYTAIAPEALKELLSTGDPGIDYTYRIQHLIAAAHMFRSGAFTGMNNNVAEITGTRPDSIGDFIMHNIEMFQ